MVIEESVSRRMAVTHDAARYFVKSFNATEPEIPRSGTLAGPIRRAKVDYNWRFPGTVNDNQHFPMDVGNLLTLGVPGIADTARSNAQGLDPERQATLQAIGDVYESIGSLTPHPRGPDGRPLAVLNFWPLHSSLSRPLMFV